MTEDWSNHGCIDEIMVEIRDWCKKTYSCPFVIFSYGGIVLITKEMIKDAEKNNDDKKLILLPSYPAYRITNKTFDKDRYDYVMTKIKTLASRQQLLYRAAVMYLSKAGYPYAGSQAADNIIRIRDGKMWECQYRYHAHAMFHFPTKEASEVNDLSQLCTMSGLRADQMMLIPYYIHEEGKYDPPRQPLDPKIWDNPYQEGIYDNPATTGMRTFSFTPSANLAVKSAMGLTS